MATYFVDFVNGLDANNGLGPDASAATNKPWKTMAKALGAAGIASGDTVYMSPAGPFREVVGVAMTTPAAETFILADPGNARGFKTSGGVLVSPGPVVWTSYTTNDITTPSTSAALDLNSRAHLTIRGIMFVGGGGSGGCLDCDTATDLLVEDCLFAPGIAGVNAVDLTCAFGVAANVTFNRCIFYTSNFGGLAITLNTSATGADYDANVLITNCRFIGSYGDGIWVAGSANQTFRGGGVRIRNIFVHGTTAINTGNVYTSTSIPIEIDNSLIYQVSNPGISADAAGQIVEDWNLLICCNTPRLNVTAGSNSKLNYAPMFHTGQERFWGMQQRPYGEPMVGSPLLGFGSDGSHPTSDGLNRPRPAGGGSASAGVGWLERGNSWGRETTTVRTGSNALSITGPGYQDFLIPVDASATTVTCYLRQDTTYAGTSPKLIALANAEIGVTEQTDTLAVADDTWEQLSVSFTPTAKGIITIRLLSSDTNGGGKAFSDDFAVT